MAGVDAQQLARLQLLDEDLAVEVDKGAAGAGQALQYEALAAEEACAEPLAEVHVQIDALVGTHEGVLLHNVRLPVGQIKIEDLAGELRGKGNLALAPFDVVVNDKERFAGEGAFEHLPQTAAGIGVHLHVLRHPAHATGG